METLRTETRKANKTHQCGFCLGKIYTGQKYNIQIIKSDDFYTWKEHLECRALADKVVDWNDLIGEGCSSEDFYYFVGCKYEEITGLPNIKTPLSEQLEIVMNHYNVI